jgi:hypothetical protein
MYKYTKGQKVMIVGATNRYNRAVGEVTDSENFMVNVILDNHTFSILNIDDEILDFWSWGKACPNLLKCDICDRRFLCFTKK